MPRFALVDLMRMPWTFSRRECREGEAIHFELRIAELPDFFLAGTTRQELLDELRPALSTFLDSYLSQGEDPPTPQHPELWRMILFARPGAGQVLPPIVRSPQDGETRNQDAGEFAMA